MKMWCAKCQADVDAYSGASFYGRACSKCHELLVGPNRPPDPRPKLAPSVVEDDDSGTIRPPVWIDFMHKGVSYRAVLSPEGALTASYIDPLSGDRRPLYHNEPENHATLLAMFARVTFMALTTNLQAFADLNNEGALVFTIGHIP